MQFLTLITIGLLVVSILLSYFNMRLSSPILSILNRWLRWFVFSLGVASVTVEMEWSGKPFWLIFLTAFLGWFLFESIYTWLIISALSRSEIPLFPKFKTNLRGDEWPAQRKFIAIKDWLRSNGFKKLESVKAEIEDSIAIRSTIYQDELGITRIQVLFFPQKTGSVSVCYIVSSQTVEGDHYLTDNVFLPFGGYYPENWNILRKPLHSSLERILKLHKRRLQGFEILPWSADDPLHELNKQQNQLEQINLQFGFLLPNEFQEEYGRLTKEGRYRIWKEIWLINYLGLTVNY